MSDETRQNIEKYVATAMKGRGDDAVRALSEFREGLQEIAGRLEQAIRSASSSPVSIPDDLFPAPAAAEVGLLSHVLSSQREILAAGDQIGLLTQLLMSCTVSCARVAFFIVKKEALSGWAARGFDRAQDSDVRALNIPISDDTILGAAFRSGEAVRSKGGRHSQDDSFLGRLGGGTPGEAIAVPVWIRDKIAAVLYGDSGQEDHITDAEIPEILGIHAGLCLETLATRQKYPRGRAGDAPAAAPSSPVPSREVMTTPGAGTIAGTPAPKLDTSSGSLAARSVPPPQAAPSAVHPAEPPHAAAPSRAASGPAPSLESLPEDERKLHEEARRFARLLVSEIVLYNERQVEEGRRQKDLYERLKEDIDRSRAMYEQRVSAKVRSATNYFLQELVRTLANGDEGAIKVPWA